MPPAGKHDAGSGRLRQPMHPHGLVGRLFGWSMDWLNRASADAAFDRLAVVPGERFLEIGFGTGLLLDRAAGARSGLVAGVDPSELMVQTARRRLAKRHPDVAADLRVGTAAELAWPDSHFDKAAALHCFQFFADPLHDLTEIRRVLRAGATFVLVLRRHREKSREWLPNPLSREGDEVANAVGALASSGFAVSESGTRAMASPVIVAQAVASHGQ